MSHGEEFHPARRHRHHLHGAARHQLWQHGHAGSLPMAVHPVRDRGHRPRRDGHPRHDHAHQRRGQILQRRNGRADRGRSSRRFITATNRRSNKVAGELALRSTMGTSASGRVTSRAGWTGSCPLARPLSPASARANAGKWGQCANLDRILLPPTLPACPEVSESNFPVPFTTRLRARLRTARRDGAWQPA